MKLPSMPYSGGYKTSAQTEFGGLNANLGAKDGEIVAMTNLTGQHYPVLSTRHPRTVMQSLIEDPHTLWADDDLVLVNGSTLTLNGENSYALEDSPKILARMLRRLIIFPDKKLINLDTGEMEDMEAAVSLSGVSFGNGEIFGETAEANTLYKSGVDWGQHFKVGDAVTISGCVLHPENNKTPIIREIDGDYLRFYEYVFTLDGMYSYTPGSSGLTPGNYHFTAGEDTRQFELSETLPYGAKLTWDGSTLHRISGSTDTVIGTFMGSYGNEIILVETATKPYTEAGEITLKREVPDLDYICVNENRLWGCRGDTIYASRLGDPTNFNVFDGLSTDSWQSQVGDKGDFTACISYLGYPMFFKEESIFKVFGDKPANFQWSPSARMGVEKGSHLSLAVANETLFYLSPAGIVAYTGGVPSIISEPLGVDRRWRDAVAGSDGVRYFVSMRDEDELCHIFVYDTRHGFWHREDSLHAVGFASWGGDLLMLAKDSPLFGTMYGLMSADGAETFGWDAEFADSTEDRAEKKGILRLMIRMELDKGSWCSAYIRYDNGIYQLVRRVKAANEAKKNSYVIPVVVRRCDNWTLKLVGEGGARIYSIAKSRYLGSEKQNR